MSILLFIRESYLFCDSYRYWVPISTSKFEYEQRLHDSILHIFLNTHCWSLLYILIFFRKIFALFYKIFFKQFLINFFFWLLQPKFITFCTSFFILICRKQFKEIDYFLVTFLRFSVNYWFIDHITMHAIAFLII